MAVTRIEVKPALIKKAIGIYNRLKYTFQAYKAHYPFDVAHWTYKKG